MLEQRRDFVPAAGGVENRRQRGAVGGGVGVIGTERGFTDLDRWWDAFRSRLLGHGDDVVARELAHEFGVIALDVGIHERDQCAVVIGADGLSALAVDDLRHRLHLLEVTLETG